MSEAERAKVAATLDALTATFAAVESDFQTIPPGYNDSLQFMAHLWQPLRVLHKPLAVHVFSELSVLLCHLALRVLGFRRYWIAGHNYWARGLAPLAAADSGGRPPRHKASACAVMQNVAVGRKPFLMQIAMPHACQASRRACACIACVHSCAFACFS